MKTTISALFIPLIGICMLTLASCSAGAITGPMDPTRCPSVDVVTVQERIANCQQ